MLTAALHGEHRDEDGEGNLLNNATETGNSSGQTRSAVSAGVVTITNEARQQQLTGTNGQETVASRNRDTDTAQMAAQKQDVQAMKQTMEAERVIKNEAFKQITVIGDKVYRKETEEKKLVNITCQENRTACSQAVVTLDQIDAVNGKITTFNNGMLNDEQAALMNAYMQATGQKLQDGVIVVVNPMINDVVSEAAWVAWKKVEEVFGFGTSSVGDLNLALAAIALAQGAKLDTVSHSAGNFGVAEMLRRLDETGVKDAAIGTITMFGSPVNAQGTANVVNTITSGQGTVQQSTHKDDFVGTVAGGNPATGGIDAPFKDAHSAYTGDLPSVLNADGERNKMRNITDAAWGDGIISQPVKVLPAMKVDAVERIQNGENK